MYCIIDIIVAFYNGDRCTPYIVQERTMLPKHSGGHICAKIPSRHYESSSVILGSGDFLYGPAACCRYTFLSIE